ncbi:MAG: hypothetical protein GF365_00620 [Candidatus Buchananbacteria bacterium]|nr:hypothetical protein [Candidatus Buchananbacteria bacterium]
MCEMVKRNNGGLRIGGQFFNVNDGLIQAVRKLAPGWSERTDRKLAQIIVNGVPIFDLDRPTDDGIETRANFHAPGGQKISLPVIIMKDPPHHSLFLNGKKLK